MAGSARSRFSADALRRMRCAAGRCAARFVVVSALATSAAAQESALVGSVSGRGGERLPYSIVGVAGRERSQFTDDSGRFDMRGLTPGRAVVHVRRLGYVPRIITVDLRGGAVDTLNVELERLAVSLEGIEVKAFPSCTKPGPPDRLKDSTLAAIVDQIRLNAEQYRFLSDQYPFFYTSRITRSDKLRNGTVTPKLASATVIHSKSRRQYRPGDVIRRAGRVRYFEIPTLIDVADKAFINAHCWHFAGVDTLEDAELLKVDVVAHDALRGPDVNGTFLLSRETFQIRRSVLHLSRQPFGTALIGMVTTTDFFEVLPSIPIIQYVNSVQTMDPTTRGELAEAYEEHRTTGFQWVGRKPGDLGRRP